MICPDWWAQRADKAPWLSPCLVLSQEAAAGAIIHFLCAEDEASDESAVINNQTMCENDMTITNVIRGIIGSFDRFFFFLLNITGPYFTLIKKKKFFFFK